LKKKKCKIYYQPFIFLFFLAFFVPFVSQKSHERGPGGVARVFATIPKPLSLSLPTNPSPNRSFPSSGPNNKRTQTRLIHAINIPTLGVPKFLICSQTRYLSAPRKFPPDCKPRVLGFLNKGGRLQSRFPTLISSIPGVG